MESLALQVNQRLLNTPSIPGLQNPKTKFKLSPRAQHLVGGNTETPRSTMEQLDINPECPRLVFFPFYATEEAGRWDHTRLLERATLWHPSLSHLAHR